jgi:hypothetical protein
VQRQGAGVVGVHGTPLLPQPSHFSSHSATEDGALAGYGSAPNPPSALAATPSYTRPWPVSESAEPVAPPPEKNPKPVDATDGPATISGNAPPAGGTDDAGPQQGQDRRRSGIGNPPTDELQRQQRIKDEG